MAVTALGRHWRVWVREFWRRGAGLGWREGGRSSRLLSWWWRRRRRRQWERIGWGGAGGRRGESGGRGVQSGTEGAVALWLYVNEVSCTVTRGAGISWLFRAHRRISNV